MEFWKWEKSFAAIKLLPESIVPWAVYAVVKHLKNHSASFDYRILQERITLEGGLEVSEKQAQKVKEGLVRLFEWLLANNPQNEGKFTIDNILGTNSDLSPETIELISSSYSQVITVFPDKPPFRGPQLLEVDWTAGFSISPHESYIKLKLSTSDPSTGQDSYRVIKLSQPQFKNLLREMRKVKGILSSL